MTPLPDQVKRLIIENDLCVLATAGDRGPHCSLMFYLADEDCSHIFLATKKNTQKYQNICLNPAVSMLVDDRDKPKAPGRQGVRALTLWGRARPCSDQGQKQDILARIEARHPHLAPITQDSQVEVIIVRLDSWQLLDGVDNVRLKKHTERL